MAILKTSDPLVYLKGLVQDKRFAQWRSRTHRYVALRAVKAQVRGETSAKLSRDLAPRSLIGSLQGHLKRRESVLVLGDPGAGKTTAFEALTYQLARTAYRRSLFTWFLWLGGTAVLTLWYPPAA